MHCPLNYLEYRISYGGHVGYGTQNVFYFYLQLLIKTVYAPLNI